MNDRFRNHSTDWSLVPLRDDVDMNYPARVRLPMPAQYVQLPVQPIGVAPQLSVGLAYVLWLLFGLIGAHYFYINKPGVGVLYLLTGGLLGVGWLIDLFTLRGQVRRANRAQR